VLRRVARVQLDISLHPCHSDVGIKSSDDPRFLRFAWRRLSLCAGFARLCAYGGHEAQVWSFWSRAQRRTSTETLLDLYESRPSTTSGVSGVLPSLQDRGPRVRPQSIVLTQIVGNGKIFATLQRFLAPRFGIRVAQSCHASFWESVHLAQIVLASSLVALHVLPAVGLDSQRQQHLLGGDGQEAPEERLVLYNEA
jgi:hypothetical protein